MQAPQRKTSSLLTIMAALICWHPATGEPETVPHDSDIQQIRDSFGLQDDNRNVLKVTKRVYESADHPTEIEGIYIRVPYLYRENLCVLERRTRLGAKVDDSIQWYIGADSLGVQYWRAVTPGSCEVSDEVDVPNSVHVNDPIDIETVYVIMGFERDLIQQAIARPDGAHYGEWVDSRLTMITTTKSLNGNAVEGVVFGAQYHLNGRYSGPSVYFRLIDGRFDIEVVGAWIS